MPVFGVAAPKTGTGVVIPLGTRLDWPPHAMSNTTIRPMRPSTWNVRRARIHVPFQIIVNWCGATISGRGWRVPALRLSRTRR
jgi:hypothetical protein